MPTLNELKIRFTDLVLNAEALNAELSRIKQAILQEEVRQQHGKSDPLPLTPIQSKEEKE